MDSSEIISDNVKTAKEHDTINNHSEHVLNGLSNGLNSKSDTHHKHKHKSKDRDRDKHSEKHKHKDKERDREKHSHSSSKDKYKEGGDQKKEKDERKDKDHRSKEKDKDHHSRDKDKEHSLKSKELNGKDKESKDKEYREKHKDHKSSKDREHKSGSNRDKEKHHSSSKDDKYHNSSKDGKSHSSVKDKHNSDKHKHDKPSSSDKSSTNKHSSSEKRSGDKDKYKDNMNKKNKEILEKTNSEKETMALGIEKNGGDNTLCYQNSISHDTLDKSGADYGDESGVVIKEENTDDESVTYNRDNKNATAVSETLRNDTNNGYVNSETDVAVKVEEESEDDITLDQRTSLNSLKRKILETEEESEEDIPLIARKIKIKKEKSNDKKRKSIYTDDESESEYEKKQKKAKIKKIKTEVKTEFSQETPTKRKKAKEEEEQEVWKWWEEEKKDDGVKWNFLEHKGPMFAPPYEPLPSDIKFYYNGKEMELSQDAEEIATFYAKLIEHEYTTKEAFNKNFFKDWRKSMTSKEKEIITDLKKCDFRKIHAYFVQKSEERKAMTKEEKKKIKEANEEIIKEYGFCLVDGHKEKIGNFKIEPPGLFRGRGEHPKMGMLKKRVVPEDVIINCSKGAKVPDPPKGHKWKEIRHDNTVTWLASWVENVQGQVKYVMLNPSSKLKGEKDWQKYETARKLAQCVEKIRREYREDWKSKEMRIRQRAVALYFIDKLALRAGNEKDEDQADTVGCCSLRVEHIQLHEEKDGKNYVVVFDFLGKDSIRYYNEVPVEKRVFKNLQLFMERKQGGDDLFDRLNTAVLNKHLNELMEGLTAKVFRTFNASFTLQNQLDELTDPNASIPEKILQYNRANRAVAILCNHQRSIPKSHEKSMGNLKQKIDAKREQIEVANRQYKDAKREAKDGSSHSKMVLDKKKKAVERLREQLMKLEVQETDKEENKTIALGTSKLNYLDPRISVAWCKKHNVPIDKIYNKTQRSKFRWAIDMAGPDYVF